MRLGELLVAEGLVLPSHVERALATQRRTTGRLGSLLVDAGFATGDAVARALGRQHGVPAALERHLASTDADLISRVPAGLARARQLLPVARTRDGKVVVAMRDPGDVAARDAVAAALGAPVIVAVACERLIARSVDRAYPAALEDVDVDVDLDSMSAEHAIAAAAPDGLDPDTIRISSLVSLDDLGVTRDPRQSDPGITTRISTSFAVVSAPAATVPPPRVTSSGPPPVVAVPVAAPAPPERPDLTATMARIATAPSRAGVTAAVLDHCRGVIDTLVLLAVRQGMVVGDDGFGPGLTAVAIQAVTLPLNQPSVLKTAIDTLRPFAGRPPIGSGVQDRVFALLGRPGGVVIAPVASAGRAVAVIVAGVASQAAADGVAGELITIAAACGVAYVRLR